MLVNNKKEIFCQCSKCGRDFARKWVTGRKQFSQINSVVYWTEGKGWNNYELLCKRCLKEWFEKEKEVFSSLVSPKKKKVFYNYYNLGLFDKTENENFASKWRKN
jgi:transposase-like protein